MPMCVCIIPSNLEEVHETKKEVDAIIDEADGLVDGGFFKKHEQDYFRPRIDKIGTRNEAMLEKADSNHKRLFDTYIVLLRQHLGRMDAWLFKAEERMRTTDDIKSGYDKVKQQLEEHQQFQDEIREHSMVSIILDLDITDPAVNQSVQSQVKSLSERWAALWRWSEERRTRLLRLISNWEKFRDEQIALLNWLSSKERVLKEMGATDLSNEEQVNQHLDVLKKLQSKLDEQGMKLQDLHKAGDDLLRNVHEKDQTSQDIKHQLDEFDECWNSIAKQVIERIHTLETSQSKLTEYHSEMDAVVQWMDETEEILGSFKVEMPSEEATRLQEKLDIKCDERSNYQVRVDRINRLGKDLQGTVDQPSYDFINDELKPFNQRWGNVSEQLENLSDGGYPKPGKSDCCLVRVMRQKLGICQQ
ncbi:Dystrophin [Exaiptasia diaphana]|nr:Dystrophin [Exaiptasia diaphana]